MAEHVTILRPDPPSSGRRGSSSSLPADLLEQVRGRLRLLALFVMIGTAIDPIFYFADWAMAALSGSPLPQEFVQRLGFQWVSLGTIAVSAGLRWAARSPRVSTDRLVSLGLAYETVICFLIALTSYWEEYATTGHLPGLTWVPAGGMGEVWRARHHMLARPAAIKLILNPVQGDVRTGVSQDAVRRFEREAQATASLCSPHTVNVFDFGVSQDGAFYYVMELLDGLDANTMIRRFGPVPVERAVHLLRQVCYSLSEAESRGLVHRDIKPANVFVCRYGEDFDFVKVLDFGLVKALSVPADGDPAMTREHVFHGTPAFVAPEQALGQRDLDGRVDIYATGCVAYWLLTGQLVFEGPTPTALLVHHAHSPPSPPSSCTEMPIPEALDRLVLSCLEKDPARRPQSARELSRRLVESVDSDRWTQEHARSWWSSHQLATG